MNSDHVVNAAGRIPLHLADGNLWSAKQARDAAFLLLESGRSLC